MAAEKIKYTIPADTDVYETLDNFREFLKWSIEECGYTYTSQRMNPNTVNANLKRGCIYHCGFYEGTTPSGYPKPAEKVRIIYATKKAVYDFYILSNGRNVKRCLDKYTKKPFWYNRIPDVWEGGKDDEED